jgi:ubiquitin C-terminal hydrolase
VVYIEPFDLTGRRIRHSINATEQVTLLSRKYALYGIVYHHGVSIHSGHFTAAVRYSERWFRCDDGNIREVESPSSSEAYFLFYEALD